MNRETHQPAACCRPCEGGIVLVLAIEVKVNPRRRRPVSGPFASMPRVGPPQHVQVQRWPTLTRWGAISEMGPVEPPSEFDRL